MHAENMYEARSFACSGWQYDNDVETTNKKRRKIDSMPGQQKDGASLTTSVDEFSPLDHLSKNVNSPPTKQPALQVNFDQTLFETRGKGKRALHDDSFYCGPSGTAASPEQPTLVQKDYSIFDHKSQPFAFASESPTHVARQSLPNPFIEDVGRSRFSISVQQEVTVLQGADAGYVKPYPVRTPTHDHLDPQARRSDQLSGVSFVSEMKLDELDRKLFNFFLRRFCTGRTLLAPHNFWAFSIAPMASRNECVKHSLLALSAGYVLHCFQRKDLQTKANSHYQRAIELLNKLLEPQTMLEYEKQESAIASLMLLAMIDIINWELRLPHGQTPRWLNAMRTGKFFLDVRKGYTEVGTLQSSQATLSCYNWLACGNILANVVTPLDVQSATQSNMQFNSDPFYSWLLVGDQRQWLKINGGTGASPKLLHMFAQITFCAQKLSGDPENTVFLSMARRLKKHLRNFQQWSELSPGYADLDQLVSECHKHLDQETGKVNHKGLLIDLIGQAWVAAAQIYLQCRLYHRPRAHAAVRQAVYNMIRCVELMPFRGPPFTAQFPLFPIFVLALVAIGRDRNIAKLWFETVCGEKGDRNSVPPVWNSLQRMWSFMDGATDDEVPFIEDVVAQNEDNEPDLGLRLAWWEQVVEWIVERDGILCLL